MSGSKPGAPKSHANKPAPTKAAPSSTRTGKNERPATRSKGRQAGKEHGRSHGHDGGASVGVGVSVDLGGIGQRRAEPDPFAVGGGPPPVAHTQEKPEKSRTKEKQRATTIPDPFGNVSLTGPLAKEESQPPGPINVSDDTETPPTLTTKEAFEKEEPKQITIDDLNAAAGAYNAAWKKFLDPYVKKLGAVYSFYGYEIGEEELVKIRAQFAQSDEGGKLFDDWMKAYESVNKPGTNIPDDLVPPNKLEKAKHDLGKAQKAVDTQHGIYETEKAKAVADNPGVKSLQTEIDNLKKKTNYSDKEVQEYKEKLKKLQAGLENIKKQVANDWASSEQAKDQMEKVREAEKQLDKAKNAYKPYEQFEGKPAKAASNP
jgi:hypothetical protein